MSLKLGSRGKDVKILQTALSCIPDGIFGPITQEAVTSFQKEHGLTADGIAGPKTIKALGLAGVLKSAPSMRRIDKIILHCTATRQGNDYTVDQVREWHVHDRNFADIGYHFLIRLDGTVEEGRPIEKIGAHCTGQNAHSIGIVYAGGLDSEGNPMDTRTPSQRNAMLSLVDHLKKKYNATVHCHNEFANKACPSFNIDQL
ncbi:MAG: N-acetylmuramoyl-L-alanine amidase [Muribaculaceae bacterium]|nr:N-acetylmuramoyl-L-alanine amidase [Muribaculaceae bacterium]